MRKGCAATRARVGPERNPLTPALSEKKREERRPTWEHFSRPGLTVRLDTVLPLTWGNGSRASHRRSKGSCAEGTFENSLAFQRWVRVRGETSP